MADNTTQKVAYRNNSRFPSFFVSEVSVSKCKQLLVELLE